MVSAGRWLCALSDTLLFQNFGRGRSVQPVNLVQPDRTAHLEREYVQLIGAGIVATFAGGPWGYGCT